MSARAPVKVQPADHELIGAYFTDGKQLFEVASVEQGHYILDNVWYDLDDLQEGVRVSHVQLRAKYTPVKPTRESRA